MQSIPLADNFEYEGFSLSKKQIANLLEKAENLKQQQQYKKAHEIYSQLIEVVPNSASFHYFRAISAMSMKDRNNTLKDLETSVEIFEEQGNTEAGSAVKRILKSVEESDFFETPTLD